VYNLCARVHDCVLRRVCGPEVIGVLILMALCLVSLVNVIEGFDGCSCLVTLLDDYDWCV